MPRSAYIINYHVSRVARVKTRLVFKRASRSLCLGYECGVSMSQPPIVYGRRRHDADAEISSERSSPSFRLVSPPHAQRAKHTGITGVGGDSSYDTSIASGPPPGKRTLGPDLETDLESDAEEGIVPSFVSRMHKKQPSTQRLFFSSDDDEVDPLEATSSPRFDERKNRMHRLRALAQQRAVSSSPSEPAERETAEPSRPLQAPDSDLSDMDAPAPAKGPRGLSLKEQREMHSMSARLRRENRATLQRPEPKRYHLSELLHTIEHTTASPAPPNAMHSSDPVESSSTPDARHAHTSPSTQDEASKARTKKKWAWIEQQKAAVMPKHDEDDSDLEVVSLGVHKPARIHFYGSPRRDERREAADESLAHISVFPRTPRRKRIATNEYRSPNANAPDSETIPDALMDAAAHTFALAAQQQAGTLPSSSSPNRAATFFPPMLGLDELNATVLQKVYAQNAETTAKKSRSQEAPAHEEPTPAPAQAHFQPLSPSPAPSPTFSPSGSEKENIPISTYGRPSQRHTSAEPAPLTELPVLDVPTVSDDDHDLGEFFAPTQTAGSPIKRTGSDTSVLAQFFERGTQEPQLSGSLDIFANERRSGPVGGMTQFFAATPSLSKSQEAMPPPTSTARSGDAFAALRHAEHEQAAAPLSPDMLPSLDPSLAEHGEEIWREAQRAQKKNDILYLNEDGFFTQTKPADAHELAESDQEPSDSEMRVKQPTRRRPNSAFVFGEAEESDEENENGEHGGLAGVFSDNEQASDDEEGSEDDADLSSLLDDESDQDEETKDNVVHQKYLQQRQDDDAEIQALHERATKGLLRNRRRGRSGDDGLADLLDEDADEDELRRRLQAPRFVKKRRCVEGDGMDALAARDDAQAFVKTYNETHTSLEDQNKYDFLDIAEESSEEERVSAHTVRAQLLREREQLRRQGEPAPLEKETDGISLKLSFRQPKSTAMDPANSDDEGRVLFHSGKIDEASLPQAMLEKRVRLLEEYSHEPQWQHTRGGRDQLDRRRRSSSSKHSYSDSTPPSHRLSTTSSAPSVLRHHLLRREARFP